MKTSPVIVAATFAATFALALLPETAAAAGDAAAGKAIAERWCASCHLIDGGPARDSVLPFRTIARQPQNTAGRLQAFMAEPHGGMGGMSFSRQQIDDLIAYIESLREP
jgi:mono/diheme cytochrome c family protein